MVVEGSTIVVVTGATDDAVAAADDSADETTDEMDEAADADCDANDDASTEEMELATDDCVDALAADIVRLRVKCNRQEEEGLADK